MPARKSKPAPDLGTIRDRIDAIDDEIHRLVMERAALIPEVLAAKRAAGDDTTGFRPAREALMLRRLVERHSGPFPVPALVRIWREILAGTNALQGGFSVAVFAPEGEPRFLSMARDHFGNHTPIHVAESEARVLGLVDEGQASVGILPVPDADDPKPWWRTILSTERLAPRIVLRLPFLETRRWREAGALPALAIARVEPEATGADHSYIAFEADATVSRSRLFDTLKKAELEPLFFATTENRGSADTTLNLMEVEGFVGAADARLAHLTGDPSRAVRWALSIGAYALPIHYAND